MGPSSTKTGSSLNASIRDLWMASRRRVSKESWLPPWRWLQALSLKQIYICLLFHKWRCLGAKGIDTLPYGVFFQVYFSNNSGLFKKNHLRTEAQKLLPDDWVFWILYVLHSATDSAYSFHFWNNHGKITISPIWPILNTFLNENDIKVKPHLKNSIIERGNRYPRVEFFLRFSVFFATANK